jgi:hypothetical protein
VFDCIAKDWGKLDFAVHSIAFSPKDALQERVVDVSREGFHHYYGKSPAGPSFAWRIWRSRSCAKAGRYSRLPITAAKWW